MKKEYLILILLILGLGGYLLLHEENKVQSALPQIPAFSADAITSLELGRKDQRIVLEKKDKVWQIKSIDRPADAIAVDNMIDALKKLKLTALVSQKSDVLRYELDDEHKIDVTVFEKDTPVLTFSMGKTAPTFNHTFVMIDKDTNIYHASGSFRSYFEKDIAALRDKKVLEFTQKSVKKFTITKEGLSKTFVAIEHKADEKETRITWSDKDGASVDKKTVSNLLSALALLECDSFMEKTEKQDLEKQPVFCRFSIDDGQPRPIDIAFIREKGDAEALSGISSMNPDAFVLSKFTSEDLMSNADKLLGIEKEEDTPGEN